MGSTKNDFKKSDSSTKLIDNKTHNHKKTSSFSKNNYFKDSLPELLMTIRGTIKVVNLQEIQLKRLM